MTIRFQSRNIIKTQSIQDTYEQNILLEQSEIMKKKSAEILKKITGIDTNIEPLKTLNIEKIINCSDYEKIIKKKTPFNSVRLDSYIKKIAIFFFKITDSNEWKYKIIKVNNELNWILCSKNNVLVTNENNVIFDCSVLF